MWQKNSLSLAVTAMLVMNTTVKANENIHPSTDATGYAAVLKNGKITKIFETFKQGEMSTTPVSSLLTYNKVKIPEDFADLNAEGVAHISIDKAALFQASVGETKTLKIFGVDIAARFERSEEHANGDSTWIGKINDDSRAILTFGVDGSVIGRIDTDTTTYSIEPAGNGEAWLIDNTVAGRIIPSLEHDIHLPVAAKATGRVTSAAAIQANALAGKTANAALSATTASGKTVIDLMVLYSSALANAATRINFLITTTNQAYIDSGLANLSVRAVNTKPVTYSNTTSNSIALNDLTNKKTVFSDVNTNRTKYGADVVVFLRPFKTVQVSCGVAWLNGSGGTALRAGSAFAVVSDGADGRYYCNNTTFAHELGHTMGAAHDREHNSGAGGAFPYAYGYGVNNLYGDIMSYYSPQLAKFSNPGILAVKNTKGTYYLGLTEKADVVRAFKLTAPVVANFMPTLVK